MGPDRVRVMHSRGARAAGSEPVAHGGAHSGSPASQGVVAARPEGETRTRHAVRTGQDQAERDLFFFHGGTWLPEIAGAQNRMAVVSVQAGSGSGTYARLFADDARFPELLKEAEEKSHVRYT